ncbi:MAG: hypothetical protein WAO56_01495 [Miniphocaeibacter sp.]|uniref:hypothetical protein n=1 Tax=Miniphocaeibacter sp. TaxID=3100973 RepID=UPI003BB06953
MTLEKLKVEGEIPTSFGETLSWKYLRYATDNPIEKWESPTSILYPEFDNMTSLETVVNFSKNFKVDLSILEKSEHYIHRPKELEYLKEWTINALFKTV